MSIEQIAPGTSERLGLRYVMMRYVIWIWWDHMMRWEARSHEREGMIWGMCTFVCLCMIVMRCMMICIWYVCVHSKLNTRHLTILLTEHMSACSPSPFTSFSGASRGKTPIGWSFRSFQLWYCILRWVLSRSRPTLYCILLCPNVRRSAADYDVYRDLDIGTRIVLLLM